MFYYLSFLSKDYHILSFMRLFDSIMFRSLAAMMTALLLSLFLGQPLIKLLYKNGVRDIVRDYQTIQTQSKKGTPQMGGLIIFIALIPSILLWTNLSNIFVLFSISAIFWFGSLGMIDDFYKIKYKNSDKGLSQITKIILQTIFATSIAVFFYLPETTPFAEKASLVYMPFIKNGFYIDLGILYIPFAIFTILSISNAVNFADGMDGLAIVPTISTGIVYGFFAYIIGNMKFSNYLLFSYVPGSGEITIIMAALFGAGIGFLWYNCYPATVFMGDTGSMMLGGLLSTIVLSTKQELIFIVAGGIFVAEAFSVLIQQKVGINRLGKRIFVRAPLHDSFKLREIPEPKIVQRFWIVSIILALISLLSIKIR